MSSINSGAATAQKSVSFRDVSKSVYAFASRNVQAAGGFASRGAQAAANSVKTGAQATWGYAKTTPGTNMHVKLDQALNGGTQSTFRNKFARGAAAPTMLLDLAVGTTGRPGSARQVGLLAPIGKAAVEVPKSITSAVAGAVSAAVSIPYSVLGGAKFHGKSVAQTQELFKAKVTNGFVSAICALAGAIVGIAREAVRTGTAIAKATFAGTGYVIGAGVDGLTNAGKFLSNKLFNASTGNDYGYSQTTSAAVA